METERDKIQKINQIKHYIKLAVSTDNLGQSVKVEFYFDKMDLLESREFTWPKLRGMIMKQPVENIYKYV